MLRGGLEHLKIETNLIDDLKIETNLIDERFVSVMGECTAIVTIKVRHLFSK